MFEKTIVEPAEDTTVAATPANEAAPVEKEVVLVKMQRDYDGRIEMVHPDGVADYELAGAWKQIK